MLIYFVLIALIVLDFVLEKLCVEKIKNCKFKRFLIFVFKFRIISIFSIVFVSTFRSYIVGSDVLVYYDEFESFRSLGFNDALNISRFEFGYFITTFLAAKLNLSFRMILFGSSLFVTMCFCRFINEYSPNKCLSLVLFICFGLFAQSLNIIRQLVALGFILLAIISLNKNKIWKFIFFVIIASMFHITALIAFVYILFKHLKPTWKLFLFSIILVFIAVNLFPFAMKIIGELIGVDFYNQYFIVEQEKFISSPKLVDNLYSIGLALLFIVLLCAKKWLKNLNDEEMHTYNFFLTVYMFVPLIRLAGFALKAQSLLHRLNVWFFFSLIILVPLFLKGLFNDKRYKFTTYMITYLSAFCYMYYFYVVQASNGVVPYVFCF